MKSLVCSLGANYRYIVLWSSMLALFFGSGSIFVLVVVLKPIAADFDWPRTVPSMAYSLQFFCGGIGAILMGIWLDKSGIGGPVLLGAVMTCIAAFLVTGMSTYWEFYIAHGLLFGFFGQAALFSPLLANIVNLFERNRGFAAGVVGSGQAFSGTFWPPVIRYFNDTFGWRETYFYFGICMMCTLLPLSLILLGQKRFIKANASFVELGQEDAFNVRERIVIKDHSREVSPTVWMVTLCVAIVGCCIAMALPLAHIVSHITDIGHPAVRAAEVLAITLFVAGVTRAIIMGYISNRLGSLATLLLFSSVQTATVGLFVLVDHLPTLYLIGVVFGIGYGGILPLYPVVLRDYLTSQGIGRRTAIIIFFGGIGMAIGGWLGGLLYDFSGNYIWAFMVGVLANAINLIVISILLLRLQGVRKAKI